MAARKTRATVQAFSKLRQSRPNCHSPAHEEEDKKNLELYSQLYPSSHSSRRGHRITDWNNCSSPQRQNTGQNELRELPPGSIFLHPHVRLIFPTRAQPPRTELSVPVATFSYNWKNGYLSVVLVQLRRPGKNAQQPTRRDPGFHCQHR